MLGANAHISLPEWSTRLVTVIRVRVPINPFPSLIVMSKLASLKSATSLRELAVVLGYKPKNLSYILYIKPKKELYEEFEIPKKSGGVRKISKPCEELRALQRKLADFLQDCIDEINSEKKVKVSISHAFKRRHSIATNAFAHKNRRYVFNLDLEDFFGSLNFGRVRGFFMINKDFEFHEPVATVIAQIACFNGSLPQGSPCSPVISNLIGHVLDIRLAQLAKKTGCTYTRYADDLTFSTNKKAFPGDVAGFDVAASEWGVGRKLKKIIKDSGFVVNSKKTRMQFSTSVQSVTGLVVNKKVNVSYAYRRNVRAMADNLFKTGKFHLSGPEKKLGSVDQLSGMFSYIHMIIEFERAVRLNGSKDSQQERELLGIEKVYRQFIFFRKFYANPRPVVIYEGKTDAIYLHCAIRYFARIGKFPELAVKKGDEYHFNVEFFRFTKTTSRILGLSGGAEQLKNLIREYAQVCSLFKAPGNTKPVMMVIDNDKGAKNIYSLIKEFQKSEAPIDGSANNYNVVRNLFVIPTPKGKNKESKIEDFFDDQALASKLGDKTFDLNSDFDTANFYGKNAFAENVVNKNKDSINFVGFEPILARMVEVINYYKPS